VIDLETDARVGLEAYGEYLKPRVAEVLRAVGLDVAYERAEGDHLYYREGGELVRVTDMLGGYGASLVGHNHPALVERAKALLDARRPFNAQASVRTYAGALAKRLSDLAGRTTGRRYGVTLASTGAAAVEAAIKHAEMELVERVDALLGANARVEKTFRIRRADGEARVDAETLARVGRTTGGPAPRDADQLFARVLEHNLGVLERPPTLLTLERAFHGKSTGALSITANPRYRKAWRRIGLRSSFLVPGDVDALDLSISDASVQHLVLALDADGSLRVEPRELVNVVGCFVEPIQGEGGVREIPHDFLRALRERADAAGFPLVFDEIQCGMGRAGTFLASEAAGVRADYYLMSKSLGGGLAKISAVLVDRERYIEEFGLLHTSTFAEDDFSSAMALGALDLITADDGALMRECAAKGEYLALRLRALGERYPDQVRDVRGRGLMVGFELAPQTASRSAFLRVAAEQELLGYLAAGYLLHEHRVRVAPTLSSPETLRIQPSAYIAREELDRFVDAAEQLLVTLRRGDAAKLVRHVVRQATARQPAATPETTAAAREETRRESTLREITRVARRVPWVGRFLSAAERLDLSTGNLGAARDRLGRYLGERAASADNRSPAPPSSRRMAVAPIATAGGSGSHLAAANDAGGHARERSVVFLAHFLEPGDLRAWDRSLASLSSAECALLLERSRTVLEPFVTYRGVVQSVQGAEVGLTVVAIPFTSAQVMASFRAAEATWVREMIEKGVEIAREERAAVVGFGGYTSILTNNCEDVLEESAVLTSGNSVTAAAAVDATLAAVERAGLKRVDLGVVGAVGNIGTVLADLFAEHVDSILLVGRRPARQRLDRRADGLYAAAWQQALDGRRGGVPGALWKSPAVRAAATDPTAGSLGERLRRAHVAELGEGGVPIRVATETSALVECNAIVSATNAPKHVIFAKHVSARGPVVLCDVATPGDVSPEVARERPNAILLKGGIVRLPLGQHLAIDGMQLPAGQIYGCLAETVLLGLTGAEESLSLGALSADKVRRARALARAHGFEFTKRAFDGAPPSSSSLKEASAWSNR